MQKRTMALATLWTLVLAGCGPGECPLTPALDEQAIWNGTPTEDYPAVGALTADGGAFCTGTLVDPTTVLTAAHCVDYIADSNADLQFYTGAGGVGTLPDGIEITGAESHEDWNDVNGDIGVVYLAEASEVTPLYVNLEEMEASTWEGRRVTLVGYGITGDGETDSGEKLETEVAIYAFDEDVFFHYTAGTNACFGDSGGPALYEFEDGWQVVGVLSAVFGHLYEDSTCIGGGGYQIRVDLYGDWLQDLADVNMDPPEQDDDDTADDDDDDDGAGTLDDGSGCQCVSGDAGTPGGVGWLLLGLVGLTCRRFAASHSR